MYLSPESALHSHLSFSKNRQRSFNNCSLLKYAPTIQLSKSSSTSELFRDKQQILLKTVDNHQYTTGSTRRWNFSNQRGQVGRDSPPSFTDKMGNLSDLYDLGLVVYVYDKLDQLLERWCSKPEATGSSPVQAVSISHAILDHF